MSTTSLCEPQTQTAPSRPWDALAGSSMSFAPHDPVLVTLRVTIRYQRGGPASDT